MAEVVLINTIL